ncbi:2OG-Fe dioxygenase family protein [Paraburkholderia azotifigens]|uniref:2OG-Fe dioxygenase family protein n=1 Tax=Paraburkholderia azotifigens TaxID=2057004 RepID=UPI0031707E2E
MKREVVNIVNGFKFLPGRAYLEGLDDREYQSFKAFYDAQVKPDPYAAVRDRAMIKIVYERISGKIRLNPNQSYFQSYGANDTDGGRVRVFPPVDKAILGNRVFNHVFQCDTAYINEYCDRVGKQDVNISVHFIRYKADKGGASFSSPVWLHLDDEPLVFIHLVQLTDNAIGAESVISEMDSKPTNVLRLSAPFDTLIVDRAKKHAVTPLGSNEGTAYRDVMLINLEAEVQQQ